MPQVIPGATYVVQGTLRHDGTTYKHGEAFVSQDEELLAQLYRLGAIKLPAEVEDPGIVAARQVGLEAENEALKAKLAELEAQAAQARSGKRGSAANEQATQE